MKKQGKIQLIQRGIERTSLCRCLFAYDQHDFYCYPNAVNDKFLLAQKDDDFLLDGYCIRRMSQLKRVEIRDDTYQRIHALYGIVDQVVNPGLTSAAGSTFLRPCCRWTHSSRSRMRSTAILDRHNRAGLPG